MTENEDKINKDLILRERLALQRTILANQSTFLSFLRTSMYFLVAGLSISQFLDLKNGIIVEILLFSLSALIFITGTLNYFRQKKKISESEQHIGDYKLDYLKK